MSSIHDLQHLIQQCEDRLPAIRGMETEYISVEIAAQSMRAVAYLAPYGAPGPMKLVSAVDRAIRHDDRAISPDFATVDELTAFLRSCESGDWMMPDEI